MEPKVNTTKHKSTVSKRIDLNKFFKADIVARVVDNEDLGTVSSDATAYGFAMVLDSDFNVVKHMQSGEPPHKLGDDEYALIATNETLRIHFLSEAPDDPDDTDDKRAVSIKLGRLTETDGGNENTVILRATLEFQIDRHNRSVGDDMYALMKEHDTDRLTKKEFLSVIGNDLKEILQRFLQNAINKMGSEKLDTESLQTFGMEELSPLMQEGLVFKRIICSNISKHPIGERLPVEPMVNSTEHKCAVCALTDPNKFFGDDEVAQIVGNEDLDTISSDCTAYGLAMVLDSDSNVVKHMQEGDPPHKLGDDEYALIATNETLRIHFLSEVPDDHGDIDDKRAVSIKLGRLTETDGGKKNTVKLRATLELQIDRHDRRLGDFICSWMKKHDTKRLTKGVILGITGDGFKEDIQDFLQTAINKMGSENLDMESLQTFGMEKLGPRMQEGLVFKRITCTIGKRSIGERPPVEPMVNSTEHKCAVCTPTGPNKFFGDDEIARSVGNSELDTVSSDCTAYGLAIILDRDYVYKYMRRGDPPRPLGDDEYALIATSEILRICFLSETPDDIDDKRAVSIKLGRLTETVGGKKNTVKLRATLEFQIDRRDRRLGDKMVSEGVGWEMVEAVVNEDKVTKEKILSTLGNDLKEDIQDFLQTAINKLGSGNLDTESLQTFGVEGLSPLMQDRGLVFKRITCDAVQIDKRSIGERLPVEPKVNSTEHKVAMSPSLPPPSPPRDKLRLFGDDKVARIVNKYELDTVSSDSTAYGVAMVLDKNFNVIKHMEEGNPPHKLGDDEYALIATNETLRICFLSGVPNSDNKRAVGIKFGRLTEQDGHRAGETVKLRATLEFQIDRHNRRAGDEIYASMKERGTEQLTKKELSSAIGNGLKEGIHDVIQTAIKEKGSRSLFMANLRADEQDRGPLFKGIDSDTDNFVDNLHSKWKRLLQDRGLVFKGIDIDVDSLRPKWKRLIVPDWDYDYGWVRAVKLINAIAVVAVVAVVSASIGLYASGIIFSSQPTVTIGSYTNGSVVIERDDCASSSECTVEDGSDLTLSISADEGYKLVNLDCDACPSGLELGQSVTIQNIESNLIITPTFRDTRTLLVNNRNAAMGNATCTVVSDGQSGSECAEVPGGTIRLEAVGTTTNGDGGFTHAFDRWQCLSDSWCGGLDLSENPINITVPESLEPLSVTPVFRRDRLVTLRVRPSSPSGANVAIATLEGGCLRSDGCAHFREGSTEVYTFQMREGAPPPQTTITAPAPSDSNSVYRFAEWQCDVGQCPGSDPTALLTLSTDVTIKAVYIMQDVLIATGLDWVFTEFPVEDCTTENTTLRCVFDESIDVTIFPRSLPNRRSIGWTCSGPACEGQSYIDRTLIRGRFDSSATLTPVYEDNP